jgi:autotransporter-associated beta strand protein
MDGGGGGGGGSDANVGNPAPGLTGAGGDGGQGTTGTFGSGGAIFTPGSSGSGNSGGGGGGGGNPGVLVGQAGGNAGATLGGLGGGAAGIISAAGGAGGGGIGGGGGAGGGVGGAAGTYGGGGGAGFTGFSPPSVGGAGGFGGGGGAAGSGPLGVGGNGGFGGGGAAGGLTPGSGGFAGGNGTTASGGGGGGLGGAIFVSKGAMLTLSGNINLNSPNAVVAGAGAIHNGTALGPDIFLMSSGTIDFANTTTVTVTTPIESDQGIGGGSVTTGGLTMSGTGILDLRGNTGAVRPYTGSNSFNGGTTIISADLNLGNNSNVMPLVSNPMIFNGGTLELATGFTTTSRETTLNSGGGTVQADTGVSATFNGSVSGLGELRKTGTGTLTLNGTNTYTGGTTINAGTLALTTTSFNPSGFVNISGSGAAFDISGAGGNITIGDFSGVSGSLLHLGANTLIFGTSNSTTFAGNGDGVGGGLTKQGSGIFTISSTSTNTYTGPTTIQAGTVVVDGTITVSTTTVNSGATLMGTGTVAQTIVNGTIIAGDNLTTISTLTGKSFAFNNGSNYLVKLNTTTSDLLQATAGAPGTATVNSGSSITISYLDLPPSPPKTYKIIEAPGGVTVNGPFTLVNPMSRYNFIVVYDPTDVLLVLESIDPFVASGNAAGAARCFSSIADAPPVDLLDVVSIINHQTPSQWQDSFNQMQPSDLNAIGLAQENVAERIRQIYSHHFFEQKVIACPQQQFWRFWAAPFVEWVRQSGNSTHKGYKEKFAGVTTALDYQMKHWVLTGGFSYAGADVHVKGNRTRGDFNTYAGTIGAMWTGSGFFTDGLFSYLYSTADASRKMKFSAATTIPAFSSSVKRKAKHSQKSNEWMGHLGGGYDFKINRGHNHEFNLYPFIDVDYIYIDQDGFTEHGAHGLGLKVKEKSYDLLRPDVGIGFGYARCLKRAKLLADVSVSYAREFRFLGKQTKSNFIDNKDCHFTVRGLNPKNNLVCPTASFGVASNNNSFSYTLTYYGQYGAHFSESAGEMELKAAF